MSNYSIEDILEKMRRKERELFFGRIVLHYQAGRIISTDTTETEKKADEETIRRQKDVSRGRQI